MHLLLLLLQSEDLDIPRILNACSGQSYDAGNSEIIKTHYNKTPNVIYVPDSEPFDVTNSSLDNSLLRKFLQESSSQHLMLPFSYILQRLSLAKIESLINKYI